MKRVALIALTIGVTLLAFMLVWVFQPTLAMFGGSLALSAALRPLVQRLEAQGFKRGMAILIWYLLILAGLTVGVLIYGVGVTSEISTGASRLPEAYAALVDQWRHGTTLQQSIARGLPEFDQLMRGGASGEGLAVIGGTLAGAAGGVVNLLIFAFAALSLGYYWLIEVAHFERLWLSQLSIATRLRARDIWRNAEAAVGTYIRTTVVAVAVSALLLLALYRLIGLPFATLLALIGGISHIVPRLGPGIALLPAVVIAFMTLSPLQAVLVLVIGSAIHIVIHKVSVRTMQQEALKVNPLLQVLLLLALAYVGSIWAMIFAPALAALIQVLHTSMLSSYASSQPQESALELIGERLERLQSSEGAERLEVASALRRSGDLLTQARVLLDGN
ncbi:MAG TPA: AI-2E family transporter, partial [Roseiflexaceae bacterium]|nr:AI-2E family transporter [Roseiflexaceae bacterium]